MTVCLWSKPPLYGVVFEFYQKALKLNTSSIKLYQSCSKFLFNTSMPLFDKAM